MTNSHQTENFAADNESSLQALVRAIARSQGQFSLIFLRCNYAVLRERMVQRLRDIATVKIRELIVPESVKTLYTTIQAELGCEQPPALMLFGLDAVSDIDTVLTSTNQVREEFSKNFPFPLLLWVNDRVLQKLIRLTPDFESWATTIVFELNSDELLEFLQQTANEVFATVIEVGADTFVDNAALNLGVGSSRRFELESATKDLQRRGVNLQPELEASLEFVLGRDASNSMEQSLEHYKKSLEFWEKSNSPEWQGCSLFCLGLWWLTYGVRHRSQYQQSCTTAKDYYQRSLKVFQQASRPDLEAKFINALGLVLQKLNQWHELEDIANKARDLHQEYFHPIRLAYSYGLLAEVALTKSAWQQAQQYTEKAQYILANAAEPALNYCYLQQSTSLAQAWQSHGGWYLLLLAQAQLHLGEVAEAIKNLETARAESKPEYNPMVYIRILEELRSLYFQQGQYLKAFQSKQQKRQIEHQHGFRAFIGADPLPLKQQLISSALLPSTQSVNNSEIATSARRQQEVNYLIKERISRSDRKLIVIHGQSGVGKSSMVNKELLPALEDPVSQYKTLPVVQQFYINWVEKLGRAVADALEKKGMGIPAIPNTAEDIIAQLQNHKNRNLLTVLIFDQFEEFFFVCTEPFQRKPFYEFLHTCLNLPRVKIILLLREDYLHYLLEWERFTSLNIINNDILSKNIRYSLKEFSPEDAKLNIQSLTARSQFHFEPQLIDALVKDLAGDLGIVRPIELQILGSQLEEDNITTLEQYQQLGSNSKTKLVERYLEQVIQDCGVENKRIAQLILFLLTDENGTRPLKTRAELIEKIETAGLQLKTEQLDLVLEILVGAGFVFRVREQPADRYHLVHDYLVAFIRQQQEPELLEELKLTKFQEKQERKRAEIAEIEALSALSQALLLSHDQLGALVAAVRAGRKLQEIPALVDIKLKHKTVANLQQAVCEIQERNRLQGHSARILSVSFSPDGQTIASASDDNTIKLWQRDGSLVKTLQGHSLGVNSVSFSPDGQMLASASTDKTVKLWRLNDSQLLSTFTEHSDWVFSVSFSPNGQTIASASDDGTVKLWKLDGTEIKTLVGHNARVRSVSFSPDGKIIASASDDGTVKLWNLNGTVIQTLLGHTARVRCVRFSPDGQIIASASDDKTVKLWNLNGTQVQTLLGHSDRVRSVSFSADGQTIASASDDSKVKLWSLDGILLKTLKGHRARSRSVSFSPDTQLLASASDDGTVKLWSLEGIEKPTHQGHTARVSCVSFRSNGQMLASASEDKTVKIWDTCGKIIRTCQGHTDWVRSVTFSPNGQILASASEDKTVKIWSLNGTLLKTLQGHNQRVRSVSFSPNGKIIASASDDQTIKLWHLDGTEISTFSGHSNWIWSVTFSPDGQTIASASDDKTVKLWNLEGLELRTFQGHQNWVRSVSFSPDGKAIASASDDGTVKLWSIDGRELQTFEGHRDAVNSVTFSPDGKFIASASDDKTVKLWNLAGKDIQTFHGHNNCVNSVSFSPDGKFIASASDGKTVRIWKINHLDAPTELDALLVRGCEWLHAYLSTNPCISESDRYLCNDIQRFSDRHSRNC
ncbi:MAG: AAA family ATPase [Nostoc sp. ChiSLP02]|nr:AAA family ATPase [Nostoc sp. DedSLP05]MDZ8098065.1 AAA family ATPase [Nostoc sp. DedSLP01]MDZ8189329.1 AAA family ATPase [Nostoc sp. ChiSLP02]